MKKIYLMVFLGIFLVNSCSANTNVSTNAAGPSTPDVNQNSETSSVANTSVKVFSTTTSLPAQTVEPSPLPSPEPTITPPGINAENYTQFIVTTQYLEGLKKAVKGLQNDYYLGGITISPDGRYIAIGGCTKGYRFSCPNDVFGSTSFLVILDSGTSEVVSDIPEYDITITGLGFSPDSKQLVYATYPQRIMVWDIPSQTISKTVYKNEQPHTKIRMKVSPVDYQIAVTSVDRLMIFDYMSGEKVKELPAIENGPQYSADGTKLAIYSAESGSEITVYKTSTWEEISRIQVSLDDSKFGYSMDISPDGKWIVTRMVSDKSFVRLWDANTGKQIKLFDESTGEALSVKFSPNNKLLLISRISDVEYIGNISVFEMDTWKLLGVMSYYVGNSNLSFDSKGENIIASDEHFIWRWELKTEKVKQADEVVINFFDALSREDYETATTLFQPSDEDIKNLEASGFKTSDKAGLLEQICASKTRICLPVLQVLPGGGLTQFNEYEVHIQFKAPDGSPFVDSYGILNHYALVGMDAEQKMKVSFIPYNE